MGSPVGTAPICSPALGPLGVFSGPFMGHQNVDLIQIDCKLFLQQKKTTTTTTHTQMSLFRISRECQFGFSHMQVFARQEKENIFTEEERELGGL